MDRGEALRLLALDPLEVTETEEYQAGFFEPSDSQGVARLFYAVYGDGYPIDTYYIPERLAEENRLGNIRSVVARTASGLVVSHVACHRSSPANPNLYEMGVGLTLPAYRSSRAFSVVAQLVMELAGTDGVDGFYGEAVCNHTITQKMFRQYQTLETALEPALMPAEAYRAVEGGAGRVGCVVHSRVARDCSRPLYVPSAYREQLAFILDGLGLDRELLVGGASPSGGGARIDVQRFDAAGVARCTVAAPGEDLAARLRELEQGELPDNCALVQFFVDLGQPWSGAVVEQLRGSGYCLGGLLPIWFGSDALLMQRHFVDPGFDGMNIYSERGRALLEMVRGDWRRCR